VASSPDAAATADSISPTADLRFITLASIGDTRPGVHRPHPLNRRTESFQVIRMSLNHRPNGEDKTLSWITSHGPAGHGVLAGLGFTGRLVDR
jgi:hypothetical protein